MEIWRIVYRHVNDQNWKQVGSKIYFKKGTAAGVLKRHACLEKHNWDDTEKVWVHPGGMLLYRIQNAIVDWKDYESI